MFYWIRSIFILLGLIDVELLMSSCYSVLECCNIFSEVKLSIRSSFVILILGQLLMVRSRYSFGEKEQQSRLLGLLKKNYNHV